MARVSQIFHLGATQGGLDFVDIDVDGDAPLYIDPSSIRAQSGDFADASEAALQSFFASLLDAIRSKDKTRIAELIFPLVEPNETHLGESVGKSRGNSLGNTKLANRLVDQLAKSKAVASGFLEDLEDTALFVPGIDKDIVSDITTSVIRRQLIEYTQRMCVFWEIPMEQQSAGPLWDMQAKVWDSSETANLPRGDDNKLLLVPKAIVRGTLTVDRGRYYRGYLREHFIADLINSPDLSLVRVLRNKRVVPNMKAIDNRLGTKKSDIFDQTENYPSALADYRKSIKSTPNVPLDNDRLGARVGTPGIALQDLMDEIKAIAPGTPGANPYHRAVAKLLVALFDAQLGNCRIEDEIHNGLKRIDIGFDNVAGTGFFRWLSLHYPAATVIAECKNYGKEVANPEFDQLGMRFAPSRGTFGFLVCRALENKKRALERAKNAAVDGHGYIILLDDDDLQSLVDEFNAHAASFSELPFNFPLIRARFDALLGA